MTRYLSGLSRAGFLCALSTAACGNEASVGSDGDDCYPGVTCRTESLGVDLSKMPEPASTSDVEDLPATWTHETLRSISLRLEAPTNPLLGGLAGLGSGQPPALLASGPGGTWVFAKAGDRLAVFQVDANGELLAEASVAPPPDARMDDSEQHIVKVLCHAHGHEDGPVLTLTWSVPCPEETEEGSADCARTETLVFGDVPESEPLRIPGGTHSSAGCAVVYASRDTEGTGVLLQAYDGSPLVKRDLSGELVWENDWPAMPVHETYWPRGSSLSPTDTLVTGLQLQVEPGLALPYESDVVLLEVGREDAALAFVTLAQGLAFGAPYALPMHDPFGRLILLMTHDLEPFPGDLIVVRHDSKREITQTAWIQRNDYLTLTPRASATDSESNIYVATVSGDRQPEQQQALLCRVTSDFTDVRCFAIDGVPLALLADAPGEVYTLSLAGLQRYDVPL